MTKAFFSRIGVAAVAATSGVLFGRIIAPSLAAKFPATPWLVPVMMIATVIIFMAAGIGFFMWQNRSKT